MKMVKIKTADLTGSQLDWAVAKVLNLEPIAGQPVGFFYWGNESGLFTPSTEWSHGGPIIERERIDIGALADDGSRWRAIMYGSRVQTVYGPGRTIIDTEGPTPLIAAMRAFVASRLGDEVEAPEVAP